MCKNESRFSVIPKASVRPSKIVFYNQFILRDAPKTSIRTVVTPAVKKELQDIGVPCVSMPVSNLHNFDISRKAANRIREKVEWLYTLSKSKTVTQKKGKVLYSFKMNFITLTLPSVQQHPTSLITSQCLNQFLTECSYKYGLKNYVWRLEFQKNGNAHYHIATDSYLDYLDVREIWNRCLSKLGYVAAYASKMSKFTLSQYVAAYNDNGATDFNTLRSRYTYGTASRWQNPNTVNVKSVSNARNIAFYISKYITKKSEVSLNPEVSSREPSTSNIRMWFCSRSLSKLDKLELFMEALPTSAEEVFANLSNTVKKIYDYCTVWYFTPSTQSILAKQSLWLLFNEYGRARGYIPAT